MILEAEIKSGGEWACQSIDDALQSFNGHDMRCPNCHGRVFAHKPYSNGTPAHFEHQTAHHGCLLSGYHFSGVAKPHPDALR